MVNKLVVILGPTATGKTRFASLIANIHNGCIISADSRQVYKGLDLGTGKDYDDYIVGDSKIPYYLIDIVEPGIEYNVFQFKKDFNIAYKEIISLNKLPILCGGTGLYLQAVINNYQMLEVPININLREDLNKKSNKELIELLCSLKKLHNKTDISDNNRLIRAIEIELYRKEATPTIDIIDFKPIIFGLYFERNEIRDRIKKRLIDRLSKGMIDEVEILINKGVSEEQLLFYGLEYRYITLYLTKKIDYQTMQEKLFIAIADFAKRQTTWFKRMEKQGIKINWIDGQLNEQFKIQEFNKIFLKDTI